MRKLVLAALTAGLLSLMAVAIATAHDDDHSDGQWPTTCIELNDIVEEHLGNTHNVGIYQNTFGDEAEAACRNDHRNDVIAVFSWAIATDAGQAESANLELDWPTTCVELNDIVEEYLGRTGNVGIYQNTFGDQAEAACQNDHRNDVRSVFGWAIGTTGAAPPPATPVPAALPPATPVPAGSPARIAFGSNRDGDHEIYVMNADGTGVVQLTHNTALDAAPAWSPDGRRIAFRSNRDGNPEIYVMNADGTGVVRLTHNAALDAAPAWSPDGRRIAFTSGRDGDFEIFVMSADGTGVVQLTHNATLDAAPAWSPDGRRIAFRSDRDGNPEIYVMNANGTGVVRLTSHGATHISRPAWSPNGRRIAFASNLDGDPNIFVMNANGTGVARLTSHTADDWVPAWSPDGLRVAFTSDRDGNPEIYVVNTDGSGVTRLTSHGARHISRPAWSPGGAGNDSDAAVATD